MKAENMEVDGCGCVPMKLYLGTLKFKFQIIFPYHKILLFLLCLPRQPFKM